MRTFLPSFRTLPSRILLTFSFSATVRRSSFLPLNWNDDVRAATRSPGIRTRWFKSSSDSPSEKYSCSLSELMFTKGITAMEAVPAETLDGADPVRLLVTQTPAAIAKTAAIVNPAMRDFLRICPSDKEIACAVLLEIVVIPGCLSRTNCCKSLRISAALW